MKNNLGNFPELTVTFEDDPYEFTMQVKKMIEHIDKIKAELREKDAKFRDEYIDYDENDLSELIREILAE